MACAGFDDFTVLHGNQVVGETCGLIQIVQDHDDGAFLLFIQLLQQFKNFELVGHIKVCSRFIQENHFGFLGKCHGDPDALTLWRALTPPGRNEFICWVDDAKQDKTRARRIERTVEELHEGKKRPCCWAGCIHRTDKAPSRWQQAVLIDKKAK